MINSFGRIFQHHPPAVLLSVALTCRLGHDPHQQNRLKTRIFPDSCGRVGMSCIALWNISFATLKIPLHYHRHEFPPNWRILFPNSFAHNENAPLAIRRHLYGYGKNQVFSVLFRWIISSPAQSQVYVPFGLFLPSESFSLFCWQLQPLWPSENGIICSVH